MVTRDSADRLGLRPGTVLAMLKTSALSVYRTFCPRVERTRPSAYIPAMQRTVRAVPEEVIRLRVNGQVRGHVERLHPWRWRRWPWAAFSPWASSGRARTVFNSARATGRGDPRGGNRGGGRRRRAGGGGRGPPDGAWLRAPVPDRLPPGADRAAHASAMPPGPRLFPACSAPCSTSPSREEPAAIIRRR
jgi:hypothetical protein